MQKVQKTYTPEFKHEALQLVQNSGKPIAQVARDLGIAQGIDCARKRVARLMRQQGLSAQRPRHRTITTHSDQNVQAAPNLLQRDFHAEAPNQKWVSDTTYIWKREGWLFLAVVLDLFSRMVVGWAKSPLWGLHKNG